MAEVFYISNDNVLELAGLHNEIPAATTGKALLTVGTASTFTRATGDFDADGFAAGQRIESTGFPTAANNGTFSVASSSPLTLTISEECLTVETGDGCEQLDGLSYLNSATVTVTLQDSTGAEVVGETWPLTMSYIASSLGIYRATLSDVLTLTDGNPYTAVIVADAGAGLKATWNFALKAKTRKT